jgi:hypothetical protein
VPAKSDLHAAQHAIATNCDAQISQIVADCNAISTWGVFTAGHYVFDISQSIAVSESALPLGPVTAYNPKAPAVNHEHWAGTSATTARE